MRDLNRAIQMPVMSSRRPGFRMHEDAYFARLMRQSRLGTEVQPDSEDDDINLDIRDVFGN